jgi:mannitol/fructose-specific phosphotransferase system IIA component (Ntr-type)
VLLTELLPADRIRLPLKATEKPAVLKELVDFLAERSGGNASEILTAVREREAVLSTGIGFGIAIPHAKSPSVSTLSLVAGVSSVPVPFDAIDGEPVRLFFLLVGPDAAAGLHVKALSRIARVVRREQVREALLSAPDAEAFVKIIAAAED